jgi:hypothetical protein
MDANRNPDTNVYFLECLIVSTDDTATTAATAGNGDFGTSPFFWRLSGKRQLNYLGCRAPRRKGRIEKLGAELFTCRLGAFPRRRANALYVHKCPNAPFAAGQQNGRNWGNGDAASIDGKNLRDGMTAKLDGLSGEERLRKATADP